MRISFRLGLVTAFAGALVAGAAQARSHAVITHGKHKIAASTHKPAKKLHHPVAAFHAPAPHMQVRRAQVRRAPVAPSYTPPRYVAPLPAAKAEPAYSSWLVTVNGKLIMSPSYPGAARYGVIGYPTLSFRRPGDPQIWASPDDNISLALVETRNYSIGPVVSYSGGRYDLERPIGPLRGIHDIRWTLEGGVFGNLWLLPDSLRLRGEIRHGFRAENGFVATLGGDWVQRMGAFTFGIGPRLKFGDGKFMNDVFGLTAADARVMPSFTPYKPGGGLYSAGLYASATYKQSDAWSYTLHGGYDRLTGQAAASPIVGVSGSQNQWVVGATVSYTFEVAR